MPDINLTFDAPPPDGEHDAEIFQIVLGKHGKKISLDIGYRVRFGGSDHFVWENLLIDAPRDSPAYSRAADGKSRLKGIFIFHGFAPPSKLLDLDFEEALVGRDLRIGVRGKQRGLYTVATVAGVYGRARQPVPPPVA